jgi:two-component system phosphate regulon sensor histidine kinase PhoR
MAVTVHDLKAPITISLLNLELLQMEEDPGQTGYFLTGVRRELEFMLDTIANLLELERAPEERAEPQIERVMLRPLVAAVVERISVLIQDKPALRLENALPDGLPPLRAHAHRLTRVFNNLFSNAIKYTDRGYVRVSVAPAQVPSMLRVLVEDTGQGIESDRLPKLFAYYQGDADHPDSTGIGLAFVKHVIDAYNGRVWIESERGVGTRVFLELPVWSDLS